METDRDSALVEKILSLAKKRNAIILAHNYQLGEIQDIADFVGDSLDLSQNAAKANADVIVFCGVHFMAETAAILCPTKTILLPDIDAGCRMANMVTAEKLRQRKKELPNAAVVCYINSSADVKAESDVCCTSANALKVVESLAAEELLFVPDKYLGHYISTQTSKKIVLWPGFCPTHARIQPEHIIRLRQEYPQAKAVVHPECKPETIAVADEVLSTSGMVRFAQREEIKEMIVGTEIGIIHRLRKENPGKRFIPATEQAICPNMKLITLEKVLWSLEEMAPEVKVPEEIRLKAKASVNKMLDVGKRVMKETGVIVILITAAEEEARRITELLLNRRKAACINIVPRVESLFWWRGKTDSAQESLLIVKTRASLFPGIVRLVKEIHSYDVPEIIALPLIDGNEDYLEWINSEVED